MAARTQMGEGDMEFLLERGGALGQREGVKLERAPEEE